MSQKPPMQGESPGKSRIFEVFGVFVVPRTWQCLHRSSSEQPFMRRGRTLRRMKKKHVFEIL